MKNLSGKVLMLLVLMIAFSSTADAQKRKKKRKKKNTEVVTNTMSVSKIPFVKLIKTKKEISKIENRFERMKYQLIGHFSNKEQVEAGTTTEPWQEFIVMPIFQDRPDEFWVYLEFFSPILIEAPLDQRIEQYVRVAPDSFRMEVYYLKNPSKYINAWKMKSFPNTNIHEDLVRVNTCDLMIAYNRDKPGTFKTVPPKEITCEMLTAKGASRYVDLEFELTDERYLMWFHFYDRGKNHLKQSEKSGLLFRRLEGDESKHLIEKKEEESVE